MAKVLPAAPQAAFSIVLQEEYMQQLDAVAEYITEWGVVDT
jgi:hypothetical protein